MLQPAYGMSDTPNPPPVHELRSDGNIPALTGLRFLAAFCILFSHACTWLANYPGSDPIARAGQFFAVYAMPLFFVLSGFVIHYNYSELFVKTRFRWAIATFAAARFARLYPLFLCAFAVGFGVDAMLPWLSSASFNLDLALGHVLTLTQSWFYIVLFGDRTIIDTGFGLSWSISTEMFFYLAYAVFVFALVKLRRPRDVGLAALILSAIAFGILVSSEYYRSLIESFAHAYANDHFSSFEHSFYRWLFYYSPYVQIFAFALGCLTSQLFLRLADHPVSAKETAIARRFEMGALALLIAYGLTYSFQLLGGRPQVYLNFLSLNYGPAIPIAIVIFCVSRYETVLGRFFSNAQMVMLGELSYSIYVVHTWTLRIFIRPVQNYNPEITWEAIYRITLAITLTIIVSSATYRLIEVPARRSLRTLASSSIIRLFGSKEKNQLGDDTHSNKFLLLLMSAFAFFLVGLLAYQFGVVPKLNTN